MIFVITDGSATDSRAAAARGVRERETDPTILSDADRAVIDVSDDYASFVRCVKGGCEVCCGMDTRAISREVELAYI